MSSPHVDTSTDQRDIIRTNSDKRKETSERKKNTWQIRERQERIPLTLKIHLTVPIEVDVSEDFVDLSVGHLFSHQLLHGLTQLS